VPKAVEMGMEGMAMGGKRKILVPPQLGWSTSGGFPEPDTFSAKRKFANHSGENLQVR
jgi:FKBP-type peptidyl-prolyl cis-trans isomerase